MWLLLLLSSWLVGHFVVKKYRVSLSTNFKYTTILIILFNLSLTFALIFSEQKYTAFFGENQRRNGFLSYLALSIIFLSSILFINFYNLKKFFNVVAFTGLILSIYGLMQINGSDFVDWNNPYNAVISTLGNPNFSAAIMAVLGVLTFGASLIKQFNTYYRVMMLVISPLLFFTVYQTNARQGLICIAIGLIFILNLWLYSNYRKAGYASIVVSAFLLGIATLGMLQVGPLEKFLYKPSVSIRGYYWRAGFEMFMDKPLTGVGLDRYGSYFKQFREQLYAQTYGYDITSTNAHNVFVQMFATGGIFLGLTYLFLCIFVLYKGIRGISKSNGDQRMLLGTLIAAWLALQAQAIVSIDNIGVSIWSWLIGGAIIALAFQIENQILNGEKAFEPGKQVKSGMQPVISGFALISMVVLVSFLYRGEVNAYNARAAFNPQDPQLRSISYNVSVKALDAPLLDPYYALIVASYLVGNGYNSEGLQEIEKLHKYDPNNLDVLNTLAIFSEQSNKIIDANRYRNLIDEYDPWNAKNLLQLGINYKAIGDKDNTVKILDKILDIAGSHPIAEQAKTELNF
jgi:O-antigen ligase